ncbi:MAG: hypothetical protein LBI58_04570 [Tannerellaceae bacterium]|jgi:hypothetical protein|nr:hypothetical protein [Tannerellaceae bacterium]
MTNKEKIDGLMSDISELGGLIAGMRDIEICPLAFFSQTFDLAYKIIRDLHMLEGLQIDVFQKQMKGYQEIIESTILLQETVAEPFELPIVTIPAAEKQAVAVSLNDSIEKKNLLDFRKAFSLNDHFYFRKELFSDD